MRKAFRDSDGRVLVPRNMTDEEFDYALSLHTPDEREQLAKRTTSMLRWAVWRLKHPKLAGWLDALAITGMNASRGFMSRS